MLRGRRVGIDNKGRGWGDRFKNSPIINTYRIEKTR